MRNTVTAAAGSGRAAGMASAAAVGIGVRCPGMSPGMASLFPTARHAEAVLTPVAAGLPVWVAGRYRRAAFPAERRGAG